MTPHTRTAAVLAAATLGLTLTPTTAHARVLNGPYETRTVQNVNGHRDPSVAPGRCADKYAEALANTIARNGRIRHSNLTRIEKVCRVRDAGEVIAVGRKATTAAAGVRALVRSGANRPVVRWTGFDHVGVGSRVYGGGRRVTVIVLTNR